MNRIIMQGIALTIYRSGCIIHAIRCFGAELNRYCGLDGGWPGGVVLEELPHLFGFVIVELLCSSQNRMLFQ